jgi:hypothetical protein
MNKPNTWTCDSCGEPITNAKDGWVEWLTRDEDDVRIGRGLRLVHHCSAHVPLDTRCQYNERVEHAADGSIVSDLPLESYLGTTGLIDLLSLIAEKRIPVEEVLELIKRLHVPGYEQARFHFDAAIEAGAFDPNTMPGYYSAKDIAATLKYIEEG